jgi:hypothetical protein
MRSQRCAPPSRRNPPGPDGRDYQPAEVFGHAQAAHLERLEKLESVMNELEFLAERIADQMD